LLFVCTFLAMRQNQLYHARTFTTSDHFVWVEKEMIPKVNPEASLSVPSSLTPHLANRPWISHVPDIRKQDEKLVDCIVIDPSMDISPLRVEAVPAWAVELSKLGFQEVFDCGGLKVYQNKGSEHSCFKTTPICF
ncbi:hypothetical protein EBT16_09000, partial [bacterium]|nr:hypothetical protein [bacterium]